MQISLAPLEGVTGYTVRNAFYHNFGGIDTYYTPFISAGKRLRKKGIRDVLPENNEGIHLIPQLMSNRAEEVINMGKQLAVLGYDTINLNLGCPSGTVTSKKRGSGLLLYPKELDCFLEEVYSRTDMKVSVKTRIGFHSPDEWQAILEIYRKYPLDELIVHPRVREEFYKGVPHWDSFALAYDLYCGDCHPVADTNADQSLCATAQTPLCYNGDINSVTDYQALIERFPRLDHVMIGRGLLGHPGLALQIKELSEGRKLTPEEYRGRIVAFHDEILSGFLSIFSGEKDAMIHMKEIWGFLGNSFENVEKPLKKIRKAQCYAEYKLIVNELFCNTAEYPIV